MFSDPLIDFEAIDLSREVVSMDEVRKVCLQRNRFALLDGVLHFDLEGKLIVGYKDVRDDEWWASDHIPGRPIFPGVLQCEGAGQLCTFDFWQRRTTNDSAFVGFGGMNKTRFRGLVVPPARLIWAAEARKIRSKMFVYYAQGFVDRKIVFETEIMGVVV